MEALPKDVLQALLAARARVEQDLPGRVQRVRVFGSVARGEATEESDVDVLVVVDRLSWEERGRIIVLFAEEGLRRDLVISPVVLSLEEWQENVRRELLFADEVTREGIDV